MALGLPFILGYQAQKDFAQTRTQSFQSRTKWRLVAADAPEIMIHLPVIANIN